MQQCVQKEHEISGRGFDISFSHSIFHQLFYESVWKWILGATFSLDLRITAVNKIPLHIQVIYKESCFSRKTKISTLCNVLPIYGLVVFRFFWMKVHSCRVEIKHKFTTYSVWSKLWSLGISSKLKVQSCKLRKHGKMIAYVFQKYPENFLFQLFIVRQ